MVYGLIFFVQVADEEMEDQQNAILNLDRLGLHYKNTKLGNLKEKQITCGI